MKKNIVYLLDFNQSNLTKEVLGLHLNSHNILLVPLSPKDLILVAKKECATVLCLGSSLKFNKELKLLKKRFFKYALLNKKMNLIEVSSEKMRDSLFEKMRNYHHYSLPISYMKLAEEIVKSTREFLKFNMSWPGGKRARVSIDILM